MIQTLSKHVKWRKDREYIFICDCKRLIDLKLPLKYESFMKKLDRGIEKDNLVEEEKKVSSDFEKMKLLSKLEIRQIKLKEFEDAIRILDEELGKERVRDKEFLYKKFKEFPKFFIGVFLDEKLVGIVCGFPREDYLLMSEIAIDSRFHRRRFGEKLVKAFEVTARGKYNKINVGAQDEAIQFYNSLNYKPFLLIQFKDKDYSPNDFNNLKIIKSSSGVIEVEVKDCDIKFIEKIRQKYQKAGFQYIFSKTL